MKNQQKRLRNHLRPFTKTVDTPKLLVFGQDMMYINTEAFLLLSYQFTNNKPQSMATKQRKIKSPTD